MVQTKKGSHLIEQRLNFLNTFVFSIGTQQFGHYKLWKFRDKKIILSFVLVKPLYIYVIIVTLRDTS